MSWYVENDVLHITTQAEADARLTTTPFQIGDLLDAGYNTDMIYNALADCVEPETWLPAGGEGDVSFLGDVMLVRQTDLVQRKIRGLLAALQKHGKRTFISDPPQHARIREALQQEVTLDVTEMPLESAIRELSEKSGVDIRLNRPRLRDANIRDPSQARWSSTPPSRYCWS